MEEIKIGQFIRDRRIELCMTQQQLADKLGITDKAVSKWEREVCYPDITILRELSAALEVSVNELLAGERDRSLPETVPPEVQDVVLDTVSYAETARKQNSGWKFWTFVAISIACVIAALVMGILAICIDTIRLFSLLAVQCIAIGWAVCYALLRTEDYPVRNALAVVSIVIYPFLLFWRFRQDWMLGIVAVSIAYAWAVYWIICQWRQRNTAIILIGLLGALLHFSINLLVGTRGVGPVLWVVFLTLAAGVACIFGVRKLESVWARARQS